MDFGQALQLLKTSDQKVTRRGWNGKGMWLVLIKQDEWEYVTPIHNRPLEAAFIAMKTADSRLVPWLASQTDILADDWEKVSFKSVPKSKSVDEDNKEGTSQEEMQEIAIRSMEKITNDLHDGVWELTHYIHSREYKPRPSVTGDRDEYEPKDLVITMRLKEKTT